MSKTSPTTTTAREKALFEHSATKERPICDILHWRIWKKGHRLHITLA